MTKRTIDLIQRIVAIGFTSEEAWQLRRISMTLRRWGELECGTDAGNLQRDEDGQQRPFFYPAGRHVAGKWFEPKPYAIPDRESGALKRLAKIVTARFGRGPYVGPILSYHQTDPRGCALYLLRASDVRPGEQLDSVYTRGLAVCD